MVTAAVVVQVFPERGPASFHSMGPEMVAIVGVAFLTQIVQIQARTSSTATLVRFVTPRGCVRTPVHNLEIPAYHRRTLVDR